MRGDKDYEVYTRYAGNRRLYVEALVLSRKGYSLKKISEFQGVSVSTVKRRIDNGKDLEFFKKC